MADVDKTNNYYLPKMKKFEDKELEKQKIIENLLDLTYSLFKMR